eukprot:Seg424.1 transcript_id=Seg424.1/GoldUCD/mRNA.D3Y31 product="putative methyltransferase" protein_id=Seg424.1/GoldUCD/D3Y31
MAFRLFEDDDHAKLYSKFRPTYPKDLIDFIITYYCKEKINQSTKSPSSLAVDIGCGPGQSTRLFADHFDKVIGFDISEAQMKEAIKNNSHKNVRFLKSGGEVLPLQDASVSLVTCAQSFHWLDQDEFFKEVDRVLIPGGCLALFGYPLNELDPPSCNEIIREHAYKTLKEHWSKQRVMVDNEYKDVQLPYQDNMRRNDFRITNTATISEYMSYMTTWSSYRNFIKQHPNEPILQNVQERSVNVCDTVYSLSYKSKRYRGHGKSTYFEEPRNPRKTSFMQNQTGTS